MHRSRFIRFQNIVFADNSGNRRTEERTDRSRTLCLLSVKLSCNYNNPAYAAFLMLISTLYLKKKPTQLPPLAVRVSGDLQAVGFKKSDVKLITSSILYQPHHLGF